MGLYKLASVAAVLFVAAACLVLTPGGRSTIGLSRESGPPGREERDPRNRTDWYGLYSGGTKIGHLSMTLEPLRREGDMFLRSHKKLEMTATPGGAEQAVETEEEILYHAEPPHDVATGWSMQRLDTIERNVRLRGETPILKARIYEGGGSRIVKLPGPPLNLVEQMAPYAWFREPRHPGETLTYESYDLNSLSADIHTLTVRSVEDAVVDGVALRAYVADYCSKYGFEVGSIRVDSTGRLLSRYIMGGFEMRLEPEHVAKEPGRVVDVFISSAPRIDKSLPHPDEVTELVVEVRGPDVQLIVDGPRQHAQFDADRDVLVLSLGGAHDPKVKASDAEIVDALQEDAWHPAKHARVRKLAKTAIGDATTPREMVARLVAFVEDYVRYRYLAVDLAVMDVLHYRMGDCTEHAALFTTLARAVGIPAQTAGGIVYSGTYRGGTYGFAAHAWNEVVLDGIWVPVDPTWGQTEVDATHIRFHGGGRGHTPWHALFAARLKLVSVRTKEP